MLSYNMMQENKYDARLAFTLILPTTLMLTLSPFCAGFSASTMSGTCSVTFLEPLWNTIQSFVFVSSFVFPVVGAFILHAYIKSSKIKMQKLRVGGMRSLFENPIGLSVWLISTLLILCFIITLIFLYNS